MTSKRRSSSAFPVFIAGLALGAGLGLLLAPMSGEEMRESLEDTRDHLVETAKEGWEGAIANGRKWSRRARRLASRVKDDVRDVAEAVEAVRG